MRSRQQAERPKAQESRCLIQLEQRLCTEEKGEAGRAWLQGGPGAGGSHPSNSGDGQRLVRDTLLSGTQTRVMSQRLLLKQGSGGDLTSTWSTKDSFIQMPTCSFIH